MIVAKFQILFLALFLLLPSCSTSEQQHSLSDIPVYNQEAANANWKPIQDLHLQYRLVIRALGMLAEMRVEVTEKQTKAIAKEVDVYYFHSSAATIELFYGDYPASRVSTSKAETAVMAIGKIVRELIEANNV